MAKKKPVVVIEEKEKEKDVADKGALDMASATDQAALAELLDMDNGPTVAKLKFPNGSTIDIGLVKEEEQIKGIYVGLHPITLEKVYI
jgi:hypothetical protein